MKLKVVSKLLVAVVLFTLVISPLDAPSRVQAAGAGAFLATPQAGSGQVGASSTFPDVIFYNGTVLTMDPAHPQFEALAVLSNRIQALGTSVNILAMRGPQTRWIDLGGRTLMPGFVDPHTHVFDEATIPPLSTDLDGAQKVLLQYGITAMGDMYVTPTLAPQMEAFAAAGKLHVRTSLYLAIRDKCGVNFAGYNDNWYTAYPPTRTPGEMLRVNGVKIFTDGGACGPFAYTYTGPQYLKYSQTDLNTLVENAQGEGYQVAMHAWGDLAVDQALNAIQTVENGQSNSNRDRIEHNAGIRDDQLARYGQEGVVALIFGDKPCATYSVPPEPTWEWRWQDLLAANPGGHFAWHSDSPSFGPINPLEHLQAMVTTTQFDRLDPTITCTQPTWLTKKVLPIDTVLPMMTINAAYALFRENEVGSLVVGKYADMIILSDNPRTVDPNTIANLKVLMTMVDGQVQYCAPGSSSLCYQPVARDNDLFMPVVRFNSQ